MHIRVLSTVDEFRHVYELEQEIWGYTSATDAVPVPMLIVSAKTGGLILGAFDQAGRMIGFAYALPGFARGKPFQWSHMLGVVEAYRGHGIGWQLKLEQRRLVLATGIDLIEWTYDPLQALNAHLNFVKLGVLVSEYHLDVYGDSSSTLHAGTPTDRFIAEWWLQSERVAARLENVRAGHPLVVSTADAVPVVPVVDREPWIAPGPADLAIDAPRLAVTVPTGFTAMQRDDLGLAQAWRLTTRQIFTTYLPRGYQVVDFALDRLRGRGAYLLSLAPAAG